MKVYIHIHPLDHHHNSSHNSGNDAKDTLTRPARSAFERFNVLLATSTRRDARAHSARWANGITTSAASGGGGMGCLVRVLRHRDDGHGFDGYKGDG